MKTPYALSADYAELFDLIQDGTAIAGILEPMPNRIFPALIYKKDAYWINSEHGQGTGVNSSREQFASMCESVNLRWIKP